MPQISIEISERDPAMPPSGYEDEEGHWVELYTEEEYREHLAGAEGMRYFRLSALCNGQQKFIETRWIKNEDDPAPVLRDATDALWEGFSQYRPDLKPPNEP